MRRINALNLVGGYKLREPWARGSFAVDWRNMVLKMTGHVHTTRILTYDLANAPPMEGFPEVYPISADWGWWPNTKENADHQYCNGLWFNGTNWWAVCRAHYDMSPRWDMDVYADDGTVWTAPLPQQKFSGFVKTPIGEDGISWAYFGCGGYESGQGTPSGPTLADYLGNVYLDYDWLPNPGANLEHWNTRAPRPADYWPEGHVDSWVGWEPRTVADVRQGRWASDWLYGGGVFLPNGPLLYFPYQGTGELRYSWGQNPDGSRIQRTVTFAENAGMNRTRVLAYDPTTFEPGAFEVIEFDREIDFWNPCGGQEIDPQGRLWLSDCFSHGDAEVHIRVYQVTYD